MNLDDIKRIKTTQSCNGISCVQYMDFYDVKVEIEDDGSKTLHIQLPHLVRGSIKFVKEED